MKKPIVDPSAAHPAERTPWESGYSLFSVMYSMNSRTADLPPAQRQT
jgi:hypothetical protein